MPPGRGLTVDPNQTPSLDAEALRVLDQAEQIATKAGDNFVTVERLLLALLLSPATAAGKALAALPTADAETFYSGVVRVFNTLSVEYARSAPDTSKVYSATLRAAFEQAPQCAEKNQ